MGKASKQDELKDNQKGNSINLINFFNLSHSGRSQISHHFGFPNNGYSPFIPITCDECLHSYPPKHTTCLMCWKGTCGIKNPVPMRDC